jgi:uncharacterized membrane protein
MVEFENRIVVERPISEVFAFLADFENIPKWNYYVLSVKKVSAGTVGLGTTYHQIRKTDEQKFQITELEPPHHLAVKTLPGSHPQLEMRFILQAEGTKTRIRDQWKLETGKPGILERLAVGNVKSAVAENLDKLKQLLETGQVVLQDGRTTTFRKLNSS